MKLTEHVEHLRKLIDTAFRNRLGRIGMTAATIQPLDEILPESQEDRKRIDVIYEVFILETETKLNAFEKLVEEFTFTLFNRLAALKVMEAHTLHAEIITRRSVHGDRSFAHKHWLEENPHGRDQEMEGIVQFLEDQLGSLAAEIPLFSPQHPYHLLPTAIELNGIMTAFNRVETDTQVDDEIWKSDDVLGWLYESYNNYKKAIHKESGDKTEFNKVSIQSQVYTPRWVVKFLVDNSLGKLYLEMYPDSDIKNRYKIANAPKTRTRAPKPLTEIKMIDPATGSGNFLLYGFDFFYDLYLDQIENYGADYNERKIAELIIEHNLHGVDLDDRAIQLAQLGLYIKAKRKKRSAKIDHFNIVSSDFFLPAYSEVKNIFEANVELGERERNIIADLWEDLQNAYKFGALIRLEEKLNLKWFGTKQKVDTSQIIMFGQENLEGYDNFRENLFTNLQKAVTLNTAKQGQTFLNTKTQDAITFLQLLTQKYDVAVANPPYTPSAEYGEELKAFVEENYKDPVNTYENLYGCFIQRCFEIIDESGFVSMITPQTFMFIDSFKNLRNAILKKTHIEILVQYGFGGIFKESVDPCFFVLKKQATNIESIFLKFDTIFNSSKNQIFQDILENGFNESNSSENIFYLNQQKFFQIKGQPFIYWISDVFRSKFQQGSLDEYLKVVQGLATGDNNRFLRFHWEIKVNKSEQRWVPYAKGGTFNKWFGNLWLTLNWFENGRDIKNFKDSKGKLRSRPQNESFYFRNGITYSASGRGGYAFRILPEGCIFDVGGSSIFLTNEYKNIQYSLGLLNSKLAFYVADCLNPTANIQVGDIQRMPFVKPPLELETKVAELTNENIEGINAINEYKIVEPNYSKNILYDIVGSNLNEKLNNYLEFETRIKTLILLRETITNKIILSVYDLSEYDCKLIENKMGKSLGDLPVLKEAKTEFLNKNENKNENLLNHITDIVEATSEDIDSIEIRNALNQLYQGNNELEDFCSNHNINPINVWYLLQKYKIIPQMKAKEIGLEFLIDCIRDILLEDEDGIIPLVGLPGEPRLFDRLEKYCLNKGFTTAQYIQVDNILGKPINLYIENFFFKYLSDHVNLFSYLPKTPFIWHLSSGEHQGFEAYIIIYKWNRDSLYKLKSSYLSKRTESLQYRLQQIGDSSSAQSLTEKETIRLQLQEIEVFTQKIDELIASGYDPKLDDGVGKNIAPLQEKGMLRAEVLNKKQLVKYLNADW